MSASITSFFTKVVWKKKLRPYTNQLLSSKISRQLVIYKLRTVCCFKHQSSATIRN